MRTLTNARVFDGSTMSSTPPLSLEGGPVLAVVDQLIDECRSPRGRRASVPISCQPHPDYHKNTIRPLGAGDQLIKELPGLLMPIGVGTCRVLSRGDFTDYAMRRNRNDWR
jgi:hypothetical protein